MTKEKDNSQVVLDDILSVFHKERAPTLSEDEFFEIFCAEQLLKDYELSYDELQEGIVDGEHDGGVDAFFAFANGELITEDFDPAGFKKDVHLEVFIIQSKTGSKFEEAAVDRLISVTNKMMDLTVDPDSHPRHSPPRCTTAPAALTQINKSIDLVPPNRGVRCHALPSHRVARGNPRHAGSGPNLDAADAASGGASARGDDPGTA